MLGRRHRPDAQHRPPGQRGCPVRQRLRDHARLRAEPLDADHRMLGSADRIDAHADGEPQRRRPRPRPRGVRRDPELRGRAPAGGPLLPRAAAGRRLVLHEPRAETDYQFQAPATTGISQAASPLAASGRPRPAVLRGVQPRRDPRERDLPLPETQSGSAIPPTCPCPYLPTPTPRGRISPGPTTTSRRWTGRSAHGRRARGCRPARETVVMVFSDHGVGLPRASGASTTPGRGCRSSSAGRRRRSRRHRRPRRLLRGFAPPCSRSPGSSHPTGWTASRSRGTPATTTAGLLRGSHGRRPDRTRTA